MMHGQLLFFVTHATSTLANLYLAEIFVNLPKL